MDIEYTQIAIGVVTAILTAGIIYLVKTKYKEHSKFEQMDRAINGEKQSNTDGLLVEVQKLKERLRTYEKYTSISERADKLLTECSNSLSSLSQNVTRLELSMKDIPKPIRDEIEKQIKKVTEDLSKKVDEKVFKSEIESVMREFVNLGETIKRLLG